MLINSTIIKNIKNIKKYWWDCRICCFYCF